MRPRAFVPLAAVVLLSGCNVAGTPPGASPGRAAPSPAPASASPDAHEAQSTQAAPGAVDVLTYRGDAARTGAMPGPGPTGTPSVRWTFEAHAPIGTQAVVTHGVAMVVALDGGVHALDLVSGTERWSATTGAETHGSPSLADGLLIVGSNDGAHAFSTDDGHVVWASPATGNVRGCPAIVGHTAVFVSSGGVATALDARTGAKLWSRSLGVADNSSVAAAGGLAVLGLQDGSVVALDLTDGSMRWRADTGTGARIGTVAIDGGRVFVPTLDGGGAGSRTITTLDLATGGRLWRLASPGDKSTYAPAIGDGRAIVEGEDGSVTALDPATGAVLWQSRAPGLVEVVAVVADGVSYGASNGGFAFALDAATGVERWRVPIRGVPYGALVTSGMVIVGTSTGILYAIGGSAQ